MSVYIHGSPTETYTRTAHDLLDDCLQKIARTEGVDYTNNKDLVPSYDDSNKKADAFLSLMRGV